MAQVSGGRRHGGTSWRLYWNGEELYKGCIQNADVVLAKLMLQAEQEARDTLHPGFGVDTGTMQRRTHVAEPGYNWENDNVKPSVDPYPDEPLGGVLVLPMPMSGGRAHGARGLELGCGQDYAFWWHLNYYPYIRVAWERAMKEFKRRVEQSWRNPSIFTAFILPKK